MTNKKILIVEDDLALLRALSDKLSKEGFIVLEATDGVEGYKSITENHPDLVLLDLILPKMDGITMLQKIRGDEWCKNIPVIIMSNVSDTDKVSEALTYGAYDYLVKVDNTLENVIKKVKEKLEIEV